jgi:hypothetical protein
MPPKKIRDAVPAWNCSLPSPTRMNGCRTTRVGEPRPQEGNSKCVRHCLAQLTYDRKNKMNRGSHLEFNISNYTKLTENKI